MAVPVSGVKMSNANTQPSSLISCISVEQLFGHYNYRIPESSESSGAMSPLLILYGDNGAGKTTILWLIYNLLSPRINRGHRSAVAHTKFKRFEVQFADGTSVTALRSNRSLEGAFKIVISVDGSTVLETAIPVDKSGNVPAGINAPHFKEVIQYLKDRGIAYYMLGEERELQNSAVSTEDDDQPIHRTDFNFQLLNSRPVDRLHEHKSIDVAIERSVEWMRQQVFSGSKLGEANSNAIYADIVKRIVDIGANPQVGPTLTIEELSDSLANLERRSSAFSEFGLASKIPVTELQILLGTASVDKHAILLNVLTPYVEGIVARLDALQPVQDLLATFVSNINGLYKDKEIFLDLKTGLTVKSSHGEPLSPSSLSSGERQLLSLLCNVLYARSQPSVFIIDEPELSLNVKWQRQLVSSLLDCIKGSQVQFILATHSIELLTGHSNCVVKLNHRPKERS